MSCSTGLSGFDFRRRLFVEMAEGGSSNSMLSEPFAGVERSALRIASSVPDDTEYSEEPLRLPEVSGVDGAGGTDGTGTL